MSLRLKVVLYVAAIHAVLGVVAYLALAAQPLLLLAAELFFALSLVIGYLLVRAFFVPLALIRTGTELVAEQDFTSTFREVGQPEMDALIGVYNRMVGVLRGERLRLEEQHHFLQAVLTASPAAVVTLDFDGRVSSANPAALGLLGVTERQLLGARLEAVPGPLGGDLAALSVGESRMLAAGARRFKASRAELYDRGFPRSFFVVEELTEELRATEKAAYEKLIRTLSHEVNNSLAPVKSLLESLAELHDPLDPDERRDFAEALGVAANRLDNLRSFVRGYAEVVRLPPPERRPCDIATLVDEILLLLRPELTHRRIAAVWVDRQEVPPVELDRNQLEQVLVNVLQNAAEAIGEEGRIDLRLAREGSPEGSRTVLSLRDTGPGVPAEARDRLFTPFFSTKTHGRGLGLTLAHEILSQHGFAFSLTNHPEGGAEFRVRF